MKNMIIMIRSSIEGRRLFKTPVHFLISIVIEIVTPFMLPVLCLPFWLLEMARERQQKKFS
jgi:hypothetical protein